MAGAVTIRTRCALPELVNATRGSSLFVYLHFMLHTLTISNIYLSEPVFNNNVYYK